MNKYKKILIELLIIITIFFILIYNFIIKNNSEEDFLSSDTTINYFNNNQIEFQTESSIEKIEEKIKIYIIGQVKTNGVLELNLGSRIEDAIILAGGTTEIADLSRVNLAYKLEDGQKIYIPSIYDKDNANEYISTENGENVIEETTINNNNKININKSTVSDLTSIPGIGESTAQKIIDYRNKNGTFKNIEDIKNINGIGEKKFEKIKEYIDIK